MSHTERMIALLGAMRREMNGEVSETMTDRGVSYGLNYGVSIPSVREIARSETADHAFAKYLYGQQVRELRLAACHLADPAMVTVDEFSFWSRGLTTGELAAELAFALMSRIDAIDALVGIWSSESTETTACCALMAAARSPKVDCGVALHGAECAVRSFPSSVAVADAAVSVMVSLLGRGVATREMLSETVSRLPQCPASERIADEIAWRTEYM